MKKLLSFVLAICLLLGLCACNESTPPKDDNHVPVESTPDMPEESEPDVTQKPVLTPEQQYWTENMPRMDGSTSLIPLEAGIRSALLGISIDEATNQVAHTTTHDSFWNLLNGSVDLIFSVPLSEWQEQRAKEQNVVLEQIPVAKEGFVFVVNAKNPVDSLTQQQLRDIYSGKITNWKQVGGNDEEIIAYQRNEDSGSQNYMTAFMGDTPLMDAPTTLRPGSMAGLMDVIAINDYAEQSIGYSVYAYAADMYGNGDEIKFLAIDGVEPTKASMASGEYPLLSENYAIFNADEPENSPVRKLCEFMTSDEGQLSIAKAGYVTVRDIGFDYVEAEALAAYSGTGTGYLEDWDMPTWQCVAANIASINNYGDRYSGGAALPLVVTVPAVREENGITEKLIPYTTGITYELKCLTNTELQDKINAFIASAVKEADSQTEFMYNYIDGLNPAKKEYSRFCQAVDRVNDIHNFRPSALVDVKAKNGYIWATVKQLYWDMAQDGEYEKYFRTQARTWDIFTGEEVTAEELFRKGLDIDEFLNAFLTKASQTQIDPFAGYPEMKTEFARLPETGWTVTPEAIYIDMDNPYFAVGYKFEFDGIPGILCSEVPRDMTGQFKEKNSSGLSLSAKVADYATVGIFLYQSPYKPVYTYNESNDYNIELLDETVGNSKVRAKINKSFKKHLEDITHKNAVKYFNSKGYNVIEEDIDWWYSWGMEEYGEWIAVFYGYGPMNVYTGTKTLNWDESTGYYIYDLKTGEELSWEDLLVEDWEEKYGSGINTTPLTSFSGFSIRYGEDITKPLTFNFGSYQIHLPLEALKIASELPK